MNSEEDVLQRIRRRRDELGPDLMILTHHYQRRELVDLGHVRGDSFRLAQEGAANHRARHIVFCGVRFMAETADILRAPHQRVHLPNLQAGCPMADMAEEGRVETAWQELMEMLGDEAGGSGQWTGSPEVQKSVGATPRGCPVSRSPEVSRGNPPWLPSIEGLGKGIVPVTYMNSWAELKAFCGRHGGTVCTSSNAGRAFRWALQHFGKIFFFPDEHLGRNVAREMGLSPDQIELWKWREPYGGLTPERLKRARLVLWQGSCHVHQKFTLQQVERLRQLHPRAVLVVHPECREEVAAEADFVGSTEQIVHFVREAPAGSLIYIATEVNLVSRLALEHPDKAIHALTPSLCPNQYKISPGHVLETLEHLDKEDQVVRVSEPLRREALQAVNQMLQLPPE